MVDAFVALVLLATMQAADGAAASEGEKTVLSCRLISAQIGPGSDISVFQREDMKKQNCPANFPVKDVNGDVYVLSAIVRAIPSVPGSTKCGASLEALVRYDVGADGHTTNVEALSGSPKAWVKRAVKAVKKMRFEPYVVDGEPHEIIGVEISFNGSMEC